MPDATPIILRDVPLIAEIERLIVSGQSWSATFDARVEEVSIALFGVTQADTVAATEGVAPSTRDRDMAAVHREAEARFDLEQAMTLPVERDMSVVDYYVWWEDRGFDIEDEGGSWVPLRCLHLFGRQMIAAAEGLVPGAKLTLDGSGTRSTPDADTWGKALAAQAREFKARKR